MSTTLAKYTVVIRNSTMLSESKDSDERSSNLDSQVVLSKNQSNRTKLQAPNCIRSGITDGTRSASPSRPGDVSKLFSGDSTYSGAQAEPIKGRFRICLNACQLYGVGVEARTLMFPLMKTTFSRGPPLVFLIDEVFFEA